MTVYFPKWYLKGLRDNPLQSGGFVKKVVNLDWRAYIRFLNWVPDALKMPELELIDHAGLDSAVYLHIYLLGFWTHIIMAYASTVWTCFVLQKEYVKVEAMRLQFLASEKRRPDQFTIAEERERVKNDPKSIMPAAFVSFKTRPFIKSFIQGFLPGIALKIFLIFLPTILMLMSKFEGWESISVLERRSASKYYIFNFVNVFLGSIIAGAAFDQLNNFLHQSTNEIPKTICVAIPMKATFFYIMVDGWAGFAGEILRLKPLIIFHLKNFFLVKTERDREKAMDPGSLDFNTGELQIQLYFLLGLVYAVVMPFLRPFILVFFGLAYIVFHHQIINVYHQKYESGAAFWPDVHRRIIFALVFSHLSLLGLLSTKCVAQSTPFLIALPVLTIAFHFFCKGRYQPTFTRYPPQVGWGEASMIEAERLSLEEALKDPANRRFVLLSERKHAEVVADDDVVFPVFKMFCKRSHNYIPDEHYVQTLLAMHDCEGELEPRTITYTQWNQSATNMDKSSWHPMTFSYADAGPEQIKRIKVYLEGTYIVFDSLPLVNDVM
ncbi:hypothetical protein RND71_019385 [Anisodus tanguticus]|uniref:Uncharacterized protein n=1 Tax=Anisodus tanguticus TaxID=243964 RepID=A0AAE1RYW9_9SOLA|nr:hypothetical protein RND71_019385 [Anisodus tanguticus]